MSICSICSCSSSSVPNSVLQKLHQWTAAEDCMIYIGFACSPSTRYTPGNKLITTVRWPSARFSPATKQFTTTQESCASIHQGVIDWYRNNCAQFKHTWTYICDGFVHRLSVPHNCNKQHHVHPQSQAVSWNHWHLARCPATCTRWNQVHHKLTKPKPTMLCVCVCCISSVLFLLVASGSYII